MAVTDQPTLNSCTDFTNYPEFQTKYQGNVLNFKFQLTSSSSIQPRQEAYVPPMVAGRVGTMTVSDPAHATIEVSASSYADLGAETAQWATLTSAALITIPGTITGIRITNTDTSAETLRVEVCF